MFRFLYNKKYVRLNEKKKKNRKSQLKEKWRKFDFGLINESVLESGSLWNVK